MNIEIVGAGRAAGSIALAATAAGHGITAVTSRSEVRASMLRNAVQATGEAPDLRMIAVSDSAIAEVAQGLVGQEPVPTVHLSGSVSVAALDGLAAEGVATGSFHPLQTMPDPETGAARLPGSWVAITAAEPLAEDLEALATSMGCHPFRLADENKAVYHAAASAASNYTNAALDLAARLMAHAGVPLAAVQPLVDATVENAFELGPRNARTGPIARGDRETVNRQLEAADVVGVVEFNAFRSMTEAAITLAVGSDEDESS